MANDGIRGHGSKFGTKREELLAALLTSPSVNAAAKKAGVPESTARRWMNEPTFASEYREARRQSVDHAMALLQQSSNLAVAAIRRNLKSTNPATELRAAELLLNFAVKGIETEDLARRIEELEALVEAQSTRGGIRRGA